MITSSRSLELVKFQNITEKIGTTFGVKLPALYADCPSRPNVPVNMLVGLETLKSGFGWSDEQMHDEFLFNVQVRYALGIHQLGDGDFDVRSIYNFRGRVTQHMQETGENLIEKPFEQVTDEQIQAYKLKTGKLRMDSTQIASNIRDMTRLQLLVEVFAACPSHVECHRQKPV